MAIQHSAKRLLRIGCFITLVLSLTKGTNADDQLDISKELSDGRIAAANASLTKYLSAHPDNDLVRFQLGSVEFFAAIEGLAQDSYRYGLKPSIGFVPFLRSPVKVNPHPQPVTYSDVRTMIDRFVQRVEDAEATLSPIKDPNLAWDLDIACVRMDMNGDGQADPNETLWNVFSRFATRGRPPGTPESFTIGLDSADVHWLRGYCHLLAALGNMILAYDHERQFDHTAQLFFENPKTPFASTLIGHTDQSDRSMPWDEDSILDGIAFIHLANFPLREPERLAKARDHLLAMIDSSRKSWELIIAETDNHSEWIPGPEQTSVVEGVMINKERLAAWRRFLDEAEGVLKGKKLIPFWRGSTGQGVNLMKAFTEPKDFDLVLWVQGIGAMPYLEKGEITSPQTWSEFQRVFQGNFIGMAVWIN